MKQQKYWKNFSAAKAPDYFVVVVILLSIFIRIMVPSMVNLNYDYDDFLGVRIANNLLNGNWLGFWDNRTLAKPPGYSFFLAVSYWLHISPILLIHILYIIFSLWFVSSICKPFQYEEDLIFKRLSFTFLVFNPALFGADFSRIYRTSLNSLAAFAMAILVLKLISLLIDKTKSSSNKKILLISVFIGLAYSLLVLTRTEGYWILIPSILCILFVIFFIEKGVNGQGKLRNVTTVSIVLVGIAIGSMLPNEIVKSTNAKVYGVSIVENYYSGQFARALKIWSGVHPVTKANPFIFISAEQRKNVYAISATAKKMENYLEKPYDPKVWSWKTNNCNVTAICEESGSWLTWEMRDAAVDAAKIQNEIDFQFFFKQIADDISAACANGSIICSPGGLQPGVKNLSLISTKQLLDQSIKALSTFPEFTQALNSSRPSVGGDDTSYLALWNSTVRTERVITNSDYDIWKSFGHVQNFLHYIYSSIGTVAIFAFLFACARRRTSSKSKQIGIVLAFLMISLLIFCGGIALFEVSSGFGQALSLYTLPAQPIFMLLLIMLSLDLKIFFKEKKTAEKTTQ